MAAEIQGALEAQSAIRLGAFERGRWGEPRWRGQSRDGSDSPEWQGAVVAARFTACRVPSRCVPTLQA